MVRRGRQVLREHAQRGERAAAVGGGGPRVGGGARLGAASHVRARREAAARERVREHVVLGERLQAVALENLRLEDGAERAGRERAVARALKVLEARGADADGAEEEKEAGALERGLL